MARKISPVQLTAQANGMRLSNHEKICALRMKQLQDNKRLGYNPDNYLLQPHTSQAESALQRVDLLSNGFKVRTTDAGQNASGNNYIYMAFASNPFVTSTGVVLATAR